MGKDLGDHRGIEDRGDDLQAPATVWAVFDVDIKYALEQAGPAHARRRGGRGLGVVIASRMGVERRARNDLGPQFGVGREHTMEANQMQPGSRHQGGKALHKLQGRHDDVGGAVAPRALELQHDLAGAIALEPLVGNGRAGDIAAQANGGS